MSKYPFSNGWNKLPFTFLESKSSRIFLMCFCAVYATFFIYYFNPLDVVNFDYSRTFVRNWSIYSVGLIGAVVIGLFEFMIRPWFKVKAGTLQWFLLWVALQFVVLNSILYFLFGDSQLPFLTEYAIVMKYTLSLGILPYLLSVLLIAVKVMSRRMNNPAAMTTPNLNPRISFAEDNGKVGISLLEEDVIMLKSENNYTAIFFYQDKEVAQKLIRRNLKNLMLDINSKSIIRVHRSYAVNMRQVGEVTREKQRYSIHLKNISDQPINVSESYVANFESHLKIRSLIHTK